MPSSPLKEEVFESTFEDPEEIHPCGLCDQVFANKDELRTHFITHARNYSGGDFKDIPEDEENEEAYQPKPTRSRSRQHKGTVEDLEVEIKIEELEEERDFEDEDDSKPLRKPQAKRAKNLPCDICARFFSSAGMLKRHQRVTHGKENAKTEDVGDGGNDAEAKESSKEKSVVHTCPICDEEFSGPNLLKRHVNAAHGFRCPEEDCQKQFKSSRQLAAHKRRHHKPPEGPAICPDCGKQYTNRENMMHHQRTIHSEGQIFQCKKCPRTFNSRARVRNHEKYHETEESQCPHCGKMLKNRSSLKAHVHYFHKEKKIGGEKFNEPCPQCGRMFNNKDNLKLHILRQHTEAGHFPCTKCDRVFGNKLSIKRHMRNHAHMKTTEAKCPECDMVFSTKLARKIHIRKVHRGMETIACPYCNKQFASSREGYLRKHIKLEHSNESEDSECNKRLLCKFCGSTFKTQSWLDGHIVKYHGSAIEVAKVTCHVCDETFTDKEALKTHCDEVHINDDLSVKCTKCQEGFSNLIELQTHLSQVHGLAPAEVQVQLAVKEESYRREPRSQIPQEEQYPSTAYPEQLPLPDIGLGYCPPVLNRWMTSQEQPKEIEAEQQTVDPLETFDPPPIQVEPPPFKPVEPTLELDEPPDYDITEDDYREDDPEPMDDFEEDYTFLKRPTSPVAKPVDEVEDKMGHLPLVVVSKKKRKKRIEEFSEEDMGYLKVKPISKLVIKARSSGKEPFDEDKSVNKFKKKKKVALQLSVKKPKNQPVDFY